MTRVEFMRQAVIKIEDRLFPTYAWPGGYTILYYDEVDGNIYCGDCALKIEAERRIDGYPHKLHQFQYDEGAPKICDGCNEEFESSYGEPDEE